MCDGKQYVTLAVTGDRDDPGGCILTFTLPE